ncbi:SIS domain-containing protein [Niveispirillum sp. SYP-B3756]|uniref:SIS domain-containing protein n=1 Tax=Niveispirillum sp. SYP-B3756 TaxID=2662178 RepID=UPI0012926225|nr:SIS domain-containing protein [Niveispirillum sp. SYP-B3756]MQP65729.1 SIS domain-containing protein [Niveispirillum sp. SYP-B3756]
MCGIAGLLSGRSWRQAGDASWVDGIAASLLAADATNLDAIDAALDALHGRFNDLMAFATHMALVEQPALRAHVGRAAAYVASLEATLKTGANARDPRVERTAERLRDYGWQLTHEVLANIDRTLSLLAGVAQPLRAQHFTAWTVEQVIENLDRLEVRGRDSAGISVQLAIPGPLADAELAGWRRQAAALGRDGYDTDGAFVAHALADGGATVRFTYKVAQLIGKLGDNGATLRAKLRADALFWQMAAKVAQVGIIAHTRWASHGAINLPNCHPQGGALAGDEGPLLPVDADVVSVLNGDIDNYRGLREGLVTAAGLAIPPAVTTDAKIIPVTFRLTAGNGNGDRFLAALRRFEGSVAIGLLHPTDPERLYLGQKGSGQALFVAEVADGLILSSENYGLAPRARASIALAKVEKGGLAVTLSTVAGELALTARTIDDGQPTALIADPIEIFSRDIFRGDFDHFFEKEVHEAAGSVRKTLVGRYSRAGRQASFDLGEDGIWASLRRRLSDPAKPAIRRIFVTGQGTAAIAGMGVAHLLRQALGGSAIHVEAAKASELSSNLDGAVLDDTLVIAISQSGTTTDTNRTVDLARAAGAWIHAIVNRRNSTLVRKADSHLFTSDGRDIEMAVASTKAFYSQVTAGKLTALCIADALGTLGPVQIHDELVALEGLPARIQEVLDEEAAIAAVAEQYAPYNRYWAVVGNGANKVAAEEIRIKLSELCYKSIPVDYTEDKKHIDLSTEPLTLVIANDLPPLLAQDTAKEVAIFKAHAGKPIVVAAKGETCFDPYAEAVIRVPSAGAGLDFVLATVAGHLWGFHAARAIDRRSQGFRELGAALEQALVEKDQPVAPLLDAVALEMRRIADGEQDAALPPRAVAQLAAFGADLAGIGNDPARRAAVLTAGEGVLRTLFEETSRPIDTIRHQAKTVTVGISRPTREVAPAILATLAELGVAPESLAEADRQTLTAYSAVLTAVTGGLLYRLAGDGKDGPKLVADTRVGRSAGQTSGYDGGRVAAGSKRKALRLGRTVFSAGTGEAENLLLVPFFAGADWRLAGLALLHTELAPQASLQQKTALLKELHLYEDLFDAYHELVHGEACDFAAFIARMSPRDLLFRPAADLVRVG